MLTVVRKWLGRVFANEESAILLILLAVALLIVLTMGDILAPVIAAAILAFMLQGVSGYLQGHGAPQWLAVSIAFTLFIGVFFGFLLILLPLVWTQSINFFAEVPRMLGEIQRALMALPQQSELITYEQIDDWMRLATAELGKLGQQILSFSIASIPDFVGLLIYLVLVPILVFFMLKDRDTILSWIGSFLPRERPLMRRIWNEMNLQVANYVRGKAVEIVLVGGLTYFSFVLLGVNYAALLALLVGLSVVIPYIGATVVTIPVAMVGYFQWGWSDNFFYLIVVYTIIQTVDGNVLVPLLFSEAVNLHPVAIILAVLIFGGLWGLWGVFFAIPLATLIKALINAWPTNGDTPQASAPAES